MKAAATRSSWTPRKNRLPIVRALLGSDIYEAQGEEVIEKAETEPAYGPVRGSGKERGGDGSTPVNPRVRALKQN